MFDLWRAASTQAPTDLATGANMDRRGFATGMVCAAAMMGRAGAVAPIKDPAIAKFIAGMPKAEYHVHLEGTLEAEMKFALARRNGLQLPFADVAAMKAAIAITICPAFWPSIMTG
jgi:adenosine deaminase